MADATNEELHKLISSWLVGSRDRSGGKAVRQERERAQREERQRARREAGSSNRPSHRGTRGATNGH